MNQDDIKDIDSFYRTYNNYSRHNFSPFTTSKGSLCFVKQLHAFKEIFFLKNSPKYVSVAQRISKFNLMAGNSTGEN